jgi:hypothetical protein
MSITYYWKGIAAPTPPYLPLQNLDVKHTLLPLLFANEPTFIAMKDSATKLITYFTTLTIIRLNFKKALQVLQSLNNVRIRRG